MTDFGLLRQKIDESGMTMKAVAEKAGILRETLYNRFNGVGDFTASEMLALSDVLRLTNKERDKIFFARKVERKATSEV